MKLFNHAQSSKKDKYVPSLYIIKLEKELRLAHKEVKQKDEEIKGLKERVQNMELLIAELQQLLFRGKKTKKNKRDKDKPNNQGNNGSNDKQPRPKNSYRRPIPLDKEVTKEEEYTLDNCLYCGGSLEKIEGKGVRSIFFGKGVREKGSGAFF